MGMMIGAGGVVIRTADPYGSSCGNPCGMAKSNNKSAVSSRTNKKKKYKKLNYNYRDVSGRIVRAKTSVSAGLVVAHARTMVAVLRRRYGCGEYNDRDLEIAIIHAEKMVRIAKKKLKNLKMEEQGRRTSEAKKAEEELEDENSLNTADMQSEEREISEDELRDMIRELEKELQELAAENSMDELTDECLGGSRAVSDEELEQIKKKHRCDEMRQIVEADMKYLKAMFQRMMQEQQEVTAAAATLELSNAVAGTQVGVSLAAAGGGAQPTEGGSVDTTV